MVRGNNFGAALQKFPSASTPGYTGQMKKISCLILILILTGCSGQSDPVTPARDAVTITVLGTNDVHGDLLPAPNKGGLAIFSGYVEAMRAARAEDGAVLLIDAADGARLGLLTLTPSAP